MVLQVWGKGQTNSKDGLKGEKAQKVEESDDQIPLSWVDLRPHTWAGAPETGTRRSRTGPAQLTLPPQRKHTPLSFCS